MLNSIKSTELYSSLNLGKTNFHAYLFYSLDKVLNNSVALTYAKTLICENENACNCCNACKQFDSLSHPDLIVLDSNNYKVEDANKIISKLASKPISASKKVFVILNFDNMNEIAQNKLLKSFEEPNESNIFILTTTKTDKLLTTILSRLNKIFVPKLYLKDKKLIAEELKLETEATNKFLSSSCNLTNLFVFLNDTSYTQTVSAIISGLKNLNTSQDILKVSSELSKVDKDKFFEILLDIFMCALKGDKVKFGNEVIEIVNAKFNSKVLSKCLNLTEEAYKKYKSNVNFGYILDNLLFNILKEKFLCK